MSIGFVFYHGFGADASYWNNLAPILTENFPCVFYDAGYYKNPQNPENILTEHHNTSWIGVGHSMGFMKLLEKHRLGEIKLSGIVGLQSFENFLGNKFLLRSVRMNVLHVMINSFKSNPVETLKGFIATCDPNASSMRNICDASEIDANLLLHDLNLLKNKVSIPDDMPHLIVVSDKDPIVDKVLIKDNFSDAKYNVKFWECSGHTLGYNSAEDVRKILMDFVNSSGSFK